MNQFVCLAPRLTRYAALPSGLGAALENRMLRVHKLACFAIVATIECFHSRDYRPYWFTETKESICIKIEFNSQRFSLGHQHERHFFVLGHQHGRRDVM